MRFRSLSLFALAVLAVMSPVPRSVLARPAGWESATCNVGEGLVCAVAGSGVDRWQCDVTKIDSDGVTYRVYMIYDPYWDIDELYFHCETNIDYNMDAYGTVKTGKIFGNDNADDLHGSKTDNTSFTEYVHGGVGPDTIWLHTGNDYGYGDPDVADGGDGEGLWSTRCCQAAFCNGAK